MLVSLAATAHDLDAVTGIITEAFRDDPVWGSFAFPDPDLDAAHRQREGFFYYLLRSGLRFPWVRVSPGFEAAALWGPPGESELSDVEIEHFGAYLEDLFAGPIDRFVAILDTFDENLPKDVRYFHLDLVGTAPEHRGKGIGMELLRENLTRVDADHMPAYLESTNPANLERYASLGFERTGAFTLPYDGPDVDQMWREAR